MRTAQEPDAMPSVSPTVLPRIPHPDTRIPHAAPPHRRSDDAHALAGIHDLLPGGNTLGVGVDVATVQYQETCLSTTAVSPRYRRSVSGGCGWGQKGQRPLLMSETLPRTCSCVPHIDSMLWKGTRFCLSSEGNGGGFLLGERDAQRELWRLQLFH